MKKNNKGFTLIELLVTIIIMISILTLAIVSYTKISKEKKKELLKDIENEAIIAGRDYFESNEYKFEISDNGTREIFLYELVKEGYIKTLVNPVTGKKLDKCNKVIVTKQDGKNNFEFSYDTSCKKSESDIVTVVNNNKTLSLEAVKQCTYGDNGWCISNVTYTLTGTCKKSNGSNCTGDYYYESEKLSENTKVFSSDTNETEVKFKYCSDNDCVEETKKHKIDQNDPTCNVTGGRNTWGNTNVTVTGTCSDLTSGCVSNTISKTVSDNLYNSNVSVGKVKDKAGHETTCASTYAKIDKINPVADFEINGDYWESRTITNKSNDKRNNITGQSGISMIQYKKDNGGYNTLSGSPTVLTNTGTAVIKLKATDAAGNYEEKEKNVVCNKDIVEVDQDGTGRTFTLKFSLKYGPTGVSNREFEYVVWNMEGTTDTENKKATWTDTVKDCGLVPPTNGRKTTTTGKTSNINVTTAAKKVNGTYYVYYCFAVRPKRSNRDNLTGIGNYYRNTLKQPNKESDFSSISPKPTVASSLTTSNTGWTIQRKHALTTSAPNATSVY